MGYFAMPKLALSELFVFLIQILVLLGFAKATGELFKKLKQPAVIGEIIAGIILGPTVFGTLFPNTFQWLFTKSGGAGIALDGLIFISALFLLFVVGLEIDIDLIKKQGKAVLFLSTLGIIVPLVIGAGLGFVLHPSFDLTVSRGVFALFLGSALAISSLPVIARTLLDLNILKTRIGSLIIAVAIINDVASWILYTVALSLSRNGEQHVPIWVTVIATFALAVLSATWLKRKADKLFGKIENSFQSAGAIMGASIVGMLIASLITEYIGIHAFFGAFFMGMVLAGSAYFRKDAKESLEIVTSHIFSPLFFVSVGLKVNFLKSFNLKVVLIVLVAAYLTKIIAALIGGHLAKLSRSESWAVGWGIAARGGMEIILAILALQAGLINEVLLEALVIMAVVTALTGVFVKSYIAESLEPGLSMPCFPKISP